MSEFPTTSWITHLDRGLRDIDRSALVGQLRIQQLVTDEATTTEYWIEVGPDRAAASAGRCVDPTVTFQQNVDTARAVAAGSLSAHEAFLLGTIEVTGDATALLDFREHLTLIAQVPADTDTM